MHCICTDRPGRIGRESDPPKPAGRKVKGASRERPVPGPCVVLFGCALSSRAGACVVFAGMETPGYEGGGAALLATVKDGYEGRD